MFIIVYEYNRIPVIFYILLSIIYNYELIFNYIFQMNDNLHELHEQCNKNVKTN